MKIITKKRTKVALIYLTKLIVFSVILVATFYLADRVIPFDNPQVKWGVTFSDHYARSLGLDPNQVLKEALTDLNIKLFRLPVNWDNVENTPGRYDFKQIDQYLDQIKKNNAQVVLVIGYKVPRWPECYPPEWTNGMADPEREQRILQLLEAEVNYFKTKGEVIAWQIENEALFDFGLCKKISPEFLKQEVNLVHSLDSRPVILTDSGELSPWITTMQLGDYMGTSLYRKVYDKYLGYSSYPYPPLYYRLKAFLIRSLFAQSNKGVFVSELQAEPWPSNLPLAKADIESQSQIFTISEFQDNVEFVKRTGFETSYLWGLEWWSFMKQKGHPEYWYYAKTVFR